MFVKFILILNGPDGYCWQTCNNAISNISVDRIGSVHKNRRCFRVADIWFIYSRNLIMSQKHKRFDHPFKTKQKTDTIITWIVRITEWVYTFLNRIVTGESVFSVRPRNEKTNYGDPCLLPSRKNYRLSVLTIIDVH